MSAQESPEAEGLDHEDTAAFKTKRIQMWILIKMYNPDSQCHYLLIQHRLYYCQRYGGDRDSFEQTNFKPTSNYKRNKEYVQITCESLNEGKILEAGRRRL